MTHKLIAHAISIFPFAATRKFLEKDEPCLVADMLQFYLTSRQRQSVDLNAEEYDKFCLLLFEEIQPWLDNHDYTEINARITAEDQIWQHSSVNKSLPMAKGWRSLWYC
ncbi:hypothetical protein [Lacticaseibacillus salsurivasis]|uniref:hypothetical protein n=1 Tax=Lacticaseibacillus salsurivasis TaxID=3081441 RepID=UPI0030C77FA0